MTMLGSPTLIAMPRAPLFSARKIVHMSMLLFAFLLPYLTWTQAAGCALLALLFNVVILPRLGMDLRKSPDSGPESGISNLQSSFGKDTPPAHLPAWPDALRGFAGVWTGIVIYPISVLALILLYRHDLYIVGATWAIMALGDGMASVAGGTLRGPALPWNRQKTWSGSLGFIVAGTVGAYVLMRWVAPAIAPDVALKICAATALVGAIVESLPVGLDDNATVPLVAGAFMFCLCLVDRSALYSNMPFLGRRFVLAVAINLALAALALGLKMVTSSGAIVGFAAGRGGLFGLRLQEFSADVCLFPARLRYDAAGVCAQSRARSSGKTRRSQELARSPGELAGGRVLLPPGDHHAS